MNTKIKNYNCVDVTKFIMAIFVVAIHTDPLVKCDNETFNTLYQCVVRCAVPFFFLASGFFLGNKIILLKREEMLLAIRNYAFRIAKMYVTWSIIYFPLAIYSFISNGYSFSKSIVEYLRGFFLLGENYNSWMLWYLLSTVYAVVFIYLMIKNNKSISTICIIGALLLLFGSSITILTEYQNSLPAFLDMARNIFKSTIYNGRIFTGFFYIPVGILLSQKTISNHVSILFLIGGFLGNFFFDYIIGDVMLAVCCIGLFCIVCKINLPSSKIYPFLRQSSTIIYLIHMYVMTIFDFLTYGYMRRGFRVFVYVTFITCLITFTYVLISSWYKKSKTKF